ALLGRYVRRRRADNSEFDAASFIRNYVALAAQRASKILGIFTRLDVRDGKPQYLRHMPRVWAYLQRSLAHPSLAPLNECDSRHVPALKTILLAPWLLVARTPRPVCAAPRHGPRRRAWHPYAPAQWPDPETPGHGRRKGLDRLRARPPRRCGGRARGGERA